jgi:hypothetical protein
MVSLSNTVVWLALVPKESVTVVVLVPPEVTSAATPISRRDGIM